MRAGSAPLKKSTVFRIGTDHLDGGVSGPVVDFVEHDALVEDVDEEFLSVRNEVVHLPRAMDNQPHRRRDPLVPQQPIGRLAPILRFGQFLRTGDHENIVVRAVACGSSTNVPRATARAS
ncbi:hypothetical protein SMRU11_04885 (plasmid) [Sinorhizobium meliloti RU11/001]|nr:hypothetical protein SMRU11_04885 [Sinorhizobium meliloti RU11/001]